MRQSRIEQSPWRHSYSAGWRFAPETAQQKSIAYTFGSVLYPAAYAKFVLTSSREYRIARPIAPG
jgi:hypothetical protein